MLLLNTSFYFSFSSIHPKFKNLCPALLLVVLGFSGLTGWGQTTLYSQNFGTGAATPTGWTIGNWTISTNTSSTTPTFSGGSNAACSGNNIPRSITFSNNLSTVDYTNITILWAARRAYDNSVTCEWSVDGSNWNTLTFDDVTYNSTWAWVNGGTRIELPAAAENAANLWIRWTYDSDKNTGSYRIDDFSVQGTPFIPNCATPVSPANNAISFPVNGNLTWNSVLGATGYRLYFGTDASATNILNGTDLGNVTTYNPPADLNTNTTYYWKVVPYNSIGSATGCQTWEFETEVFAYCSASSTEPTAYESITNVTFAGIINSSSVAKTVGYSNYSSTVSPGVVYRGQDYTASVTEQFLSTVDIGYCKIFIDFNQNGTFDLPDEYVFGNPYSGNMSITGTISIPVTATLGITRMRVVLEGAADNTGALPCGTFQWGEVEDYSINILQPCTNATLTLNTANNIQTVCVNSSINDISYAVGGSATGATVIGMPAGVTGTFNSGIFYISGNPTETGAFSYTVTTTGTPSGCSEATETGTLTVNILPTAGISDNNGPICAGDNAEFYLSGTTGAVVTYSINSGSNQTVTLSGGTATVTINSATDDQTLTLVSVTNGTCSQSLSSGSTITVNPLPEIGSFN